MLRLPPKLVALLMIAVSGSAAPAGAAPPIPIIDCHVHLWNLDRPEGIYWIERDNRALFRSFMPVDHAPVAAANGVCGVVIVQAGQHLPDNQWNLDITAHDKDLYRGVVGNLSTVIGTAEFAPMFSKLCEDDRYLGYRLSGRAEGGIDEAFFRDLQHTADRGKTVDFLLGGYSLEEVATIAERVPDLKIILDHFGNLVLDGTPIDPAWEEQFRATAKFPNVYCKVSALYGRVRDQPAPRDIAFYRPVLDLAWDCFGEDRLVFGSDWPVTRTSGDYASVLALTRKFFDGKGRGASEKLFHRNAERFYGITLAPADEASATGAPNVIVMMADDLGYGDLSCYGGQRMRTPCLDRLADSGVRLTQFYAGATVCTPSRMALLTGSYPPRLGWRGGVLGHKIPMSSGLAPEATTIAERFKHAGYRTALCGKWHLGGDPELLPMNQGFDSAFYIKSSNNQTKKLWRGTELVADPFDNRRLTEQFTQEAIALIRAPRPRPFFLYLPFTAPHFPAQAHPDWEGHSRNGAYGDVVEELDARIGEILEALEECGIRRQTLVVFLSDNGPEPGQRRFASAAPLRGLKWSSLEGGTRVPCILSWPGVIPAGSVGGELSAAIDLLPTLSRACGLPPAPDSWGHPPVDGLDLWDSLTGQALGKPHPRGDLLFWGGWGTPQAIRAGSWKLFFDEVEGVPASAAGPALFDLSSDPTEESDLSALHPQVVESMLELARERLEAIAAGSIPLSGPHGNSPTPKKPRWLR